MKWTCFIENRMHVALWLCNERKNNFIFLLITHILFALQIAESRIKPIINLASRETCKESIRKIEKKILRYLWESRRIYFEMILFQRKWNSLHDWTKLKFLEGRNIMPRKKQNWSVRRSSWSEAMIFLCVWPGQGRSPKVILHYRYSKAKKPRKDYNRSIKWGNRVDQFSNLARWLLTKLKRFFKSQ